jgi:hypothetical protein
MLELEPIGRYEWERLVRRARLPKPVKLLAFTLATYADPDGSRVRPGIPVLASVTGDSERNVGRLLRVLVDELGLLRQVARGGGRGGSGRASVYRLTVPVDLLDRLELLAPDESATVSEDIQMSGQSLVDNPVDNPDSADTWMSSQSDDARTNDRTSRVSLGRLTGHSGSIERTPGCPPTTHIHQPLQDQLLSESRTELTTARERKLILIDGWKGETA